MKDPISMYYTDINDRIQIVVKNIEPYPVHLLPELLMLEILFTDVGLYFLLLNSDLDDE